MFAAKFTASIGLIAYLFLKFDFRFPPADVKTAVLLLGSVVLLLAQPVVIAARWRLLLGAFGVKSSLFEAMRITWISVFANQFLPASVGGDVVRVVMARSKGWGISGPIMSVFFDRGFAVLSLFIMIVLLAPFLFDYEQSRVVILIAGGVALAGAVGLGVVIALAPALERWVTSRPSLARWQELVASTRILLSSPKVLFQVLIQSAVVHILSFSALALIASAFGVQLPLLNLMALGGMITLAHILPISIAGWGVRDAASVVLLSTGGVDSSSALSISLLLGVGYAIASLPGAILWLTSR